MGEPSEADRRAMAEAADRTFAYPAMKRAPFRNRKLSDRVIDALVRADIDAPERLLFMTVADLRAIPGVGKAGLAEIANYRSRFIPGTEGA